MKPIIVYKINVGNNSPARAKEKIEEMMEQYKDPSLTQIWIPIKDGDSDVVCIHPGHIEIESKVEIKGLKDIIEANLGTFIKGFFKK